MRSNFYLPILATAFLFTLSCQSVYKETANGVVVPLPGNSQVNKVRLEVISDKIIRVSATQEKDFSDKKSLITAFEYPSDKIWTVSEESGYVVLSTPSLKATVSQSTGEVIFYDSEGHLILAEKQGGGKSMTPITVEGTDGYTMRQVWQSPQDEAFYGLGQHQSDEFNYKDKDEQLFQYNTKITNPFVISTRNYGILWDNYSWSRWGDARDYAQINDVFKLYDKDGKEGGLTGTWTPASYSRGAETLVRTEPFLYFENLKANRENLPKGFPLLGAEVLFEGEIEPSESGLFNFMLYYAGYIKVYVDNHLVVPERWRTAWNPNTYKFQCNLEEGKRTPIRIEWEPDGGESYCSLRVFTPKPADEQNTMAIWSEMGDDLDYYFIDGQNMDEVISGYRKITGKAQVMPKWAMGFWQCRERYKTSDELLGVIKEFREQGMPIDNIILDWNYWYEDSWGDHDFDLDRFPDPKGMIDSVHAMNTRFMISVWPKFYITTDHYKEFDSKGWMYRQAVKDSIFDWVGPGYMGSFYDAYSAEARKLFWSQLDTHLFSLGVDSWWMDASEPNVRDCTDMDYRKELCGPTALGPSTEYFNAYGLMNAEAIYDGQRGSNPDQRVLLLTRSGFAGLQRYSTSVWSGDIASRWEDMKAQIPAGINFSMSGIPYWTMDNGGFCVEKRFERAYSDFLRTGKESEEMKEWRELNARWHQFGAFCPLHRTHGQFPYREIYNIAPKNHPAYKTIMDYTKLRYRLLPYIYSLAGMVWKEDYTLMRGLAMDFPSDTNVYNIGDQYMYGPSLMVCPVYEYNARSREVYFPESAGWYDILTGKWQQGGVKAQVDAPYEKIPVYAPAGSILLYGPDLQYTDEKPADQITVYVYGGADAHFTLYEDEGTNYNYEKGAYSTIDFTYNNKDNTMDISQREGEYEGMIKDRTFNIVLVDKDHPAGLGNTDNAVTVKYNGLTINHIQLIKSL